MSANNLDDAQRALSNLTLGLTRRSYFMNEADRYFLGQFFNSNPSLSHLMSAENCLTAGNGNPSCPAAINAPSEHKPLDLLREVLDELDGVAAKYDAAPQLFQLLSSPHVRTLVEAYGDITSKNYLPELSNMKPIASSQSGLLETSSQSYGTLGGNLTLAESRTLVDGTMSRLNINTVGNGNMHASSAAGLNATKTPGGQTVPPPTTGPEVTFGGPAPYDSSEIRMVTIIRQPDTPLGITAGRRETPGPNGRIFIDVVIERILSGSPIDKQKLLNVGDIVKEINGEPVDSPEAMQRILRQSGDHVTLKVLPGFRELAPPTQVFLRAHFSYDPVNDTLIPAKEAGLKFQAGDILQVVNQEDPNWWQAKHVDDVEGTAGLIPSQSLEERRKAFNKTDFDQISYSIFTGLKQQKKKVTTKYLASRSYEYDRNDIVLYEEVARMPPFQRKTVVLVGPPGVGKRTLKERLLHDFQNEYSAAIAHTSREPRPGEINGVHYVFETRTELEAAVRRNQMIEWGEIGDVIYGIKTETVRDVIASGKTCVLDVKPSSLKFLRDRDFMPFVVYIAAPALDVMRAMYELGRSLNLTRKMRREEDLRKTIEESARLERQYRHMFDAVLVNDNMEATYNELVEQLRRAREEPQWVPVQWVY